jgi:hypothetical protein
MNMKRFLGLLIVACLMVACGDPDSGPPLGDFPAINKTSTDAAFTVTPPSSRSPAPFTFTSSNLAVATIDGSKVTITGAGTSTITASQDRIGSFGPTSKSTILTVTLNTCPNGQVLVNGACQAPPTCISPATLSNAQCVVPDTSTVTVGGLIWVRISNTDTWTNARDFCVTTVINNVGTWRQPTQAELSSLFTSGGLARQDWLLGDTWSSTGGVATGTHVVVNLQSGTTSERLDTAGANVSCVR